MKKQIYLIVSILMLSGFGYGQNTIDLDALPPVADLMEQVTNPEADTVILCSNGGPTTDLETDYFTFYHSIPTFSTVYVKQYQQYNPAVMANGDLTLEEGIICDDTGVAILRKVVNHFNDLGKTVVITGHSFGAFLIPEYLDDYSNEDVHRVIPMAGRLNMTAEVWEAFATGYWAAFDPSDGETVSVDDTPAPYESLAGMKLMAGYGYNRHIDSLAGLNLTNLMYLYGAHDEAVGGLTNAEVNFLTEHHATVVGIEGGDHGAMFASVYMNQALDFIRANFVVGVPETTVSASWKVYPTLSEGYVNVAIDEPGTLRVYSVAGAERMITTHAGGKLEVDLMGWERGFYLFVYQTDTGEQLTTKIALH